jgi:molybdopterin converting factor small subunit
VKVTVTFWSYFRDLAGCDRAEETAPPDCTIETFLAGLLARFPKLAPLRKSMLVAVGVEYQGPDYRLREGDEVSLFPPVQGG